MAKVKTQKTESNVAPKNLSAAQKLKLMEEIRNDPEVQKLQKKTKSKFESQMNELKEKIRIKKDSFQAYRVKHLKDLEELNDNYFGVEREYAEAGFAIHVPKGETHHDTSKNRAKAKYEDFDKVEIQLGCSGERIVSISCKNGVFHVESSNGESMESNSLSQIEKRFGCNKTTEHIKNPLSALGINQNS